MTTIMWWDTVSPAVRIAALEADRAAARVAQ
jgi:hypothetical protein